MLCVICQKNEAVVHYAEVVDGEIKKLDLCEQCAIDKGFGMEMSFSVGNLAGSMQDSDPAAKKPENCSACGMSFEDYRKTGRFGCGHCYDTFQDVLLPILEQIHRATLHRGKIPARNFDDHKRLEKIKELEADLKESINKEAYEAAAQIRDELKQLKEMAS